MEDYCNLSSKAKFNFRLPLFASLIRLDHSLGIITKVTKRTSRTIKTSLYTLASSTSIMVVATINH